MAYFKVQNIHNMVVLVVQNRSSKIIMDGEIKNGVFPLYHYFNLKESGGFHVLCGRYGYTEYR